MAREFIMGARVVLRDMFTNPVSSMRRASDAFRASVDRSRENMRRFQNQANQTAKKTRSLKESMQGLNGIIATVATGVATVAGYNWLVKSNADMETYRNTLAVVLKDEQKAIETLAWAEKFAASTPFEIPQIVEATTRMSAYGINAQKTLGIVGDMAAVMGKDLMQAVEAVADAQTGELERLKEFGITKKMIEDQAKLLGTNPVNNQGQITDMKAFNAALFTLMEKRFQGGMERQSKTFKGMLSNAADFIGTMGRTLGKPIFESLKQRLANTLALIERWKQEGKIDAWVANVQSGAAQVWSYLQPVFTVIKAIGSAAIATGKFIYDNWNIIGPLVYGLAIAWGTYFAVTKTIALATKAWTAYQWALNVAMNANPMGIIITLVGLLIAGIILLVRNFDSVKAAAGNMWRYIENAFKSGVNSVIDMINPLIDKINMIPGISIPHIQKMTLSQTADNGAGALRRVEGSHAAGLGYVPFDGYVAELHKGERVLTAEQNRAYAAGRSQGAGGRVISIGKLFDRLIISGDNKNPKQIALEVIDHIYDMLDGADEVAGTAPKEALL